MFGNKFSAPLWCQHLSGLPQLFATATDLCNPGGQKCGTLCLLHNCLHSWAQVSRALGAQATHLLDGCGSGVRGGGGGAHHHWKLRFTTPPPPDGLEYKMLGLRTFCLTTPPPLGCLCFCTPDSLPPESFTKPPLVQPLWHLWSQEST